MVENIIYYFSGTGNSLDVAQHIATQLGDTKLISMKENAYESRLRSNRRVGFVCPVYYGGLPKMVESFVKHIRLTEDVYVFAILTYSKNEGNALQQISNILSQTDYHMAYGNIIQMVDNNLCEASIHQNIMKGIASSYAQLKNIIDDILADKGNTMPMFRPFSFLTYNWKMRNIYKMDYKFEVQETCNHCGICYQICPANNIELVDGKPVFIHHCEFCQACLQYCPTKAINVGKQTVNKERYHHPNLEAKDLIERISDC